MADYISAYFAKAVLDWGLGGNPTKPTVWAVGFALTVPTKTSVTEPGAGSGWTRQPISFAPAVSGTSSNNVGGTYGTALSNATFSGLVIWNSLSGGSPLYIMPLNPPLTYYPGDVSSFVPGSITINLG